MEAYKAAVRAAFPQPRNDSVLPPLRLKEDGRWSVNIWEIRTRVLVKPGGGVKHDCGVPHTSKIPKVLFVREDYLANQNMYQVPWTFFLQ